MSLRSARDGFLEGYRIVLRSPTTAGPEEVLAALRRTGTFRSPFAHEGAAMAWTLRAERETDGSGGADALRRAAAAPWQPFLSLGVGCALSKLGRPNPTDVLECDGYGFQTGLLRGPWWKPSAVLDGRECPSRRAAIARGYGRALWFLTGGDAAVCARLVEGSPDAEHLWRGVGTACTFAGDPRDHAQILAAKAGGHLAGLRAGAQRALELWMSLGAPPAHAVRVAAMLDESRGTTP